MNKDSIISALLFGGGGGSALPDVAGNAGKVLKVNSGATGTEWGDVPNELPAIASGDAGKVLKVNSGETGTEWGEAGGGQLYLHNIRYSYSSGSFEYNVILRIITNNSSPMNISDVRTWLTTNGYVNSAFSNYKKLYTSVFIKSIDTNRIQVQIGVCVDNDDVRVVFYEFKVDNGNLVVTRDTMSMASVSSDTVTAL